MKGESYELTLENYYSLANHCCFDCPNSYYTIRDKRNNKISYSGKAILTDDLGVLRWSGVNYDDKWYRYVSGTKVIKSIDGSKNFPLKFMALDDLSKMISSLSKTKEFDFKEVGEICEEFAKKFKGVNLLKALWREGKQVPANGWDMGGFLELEIGKDKDSKDSLDLNGSWRFYLKDHVFIFSEAGKLFVRYDLNGVKICEYSKYKELEAFL